MGEVDTVELRRLVKQLSGASNEQDILGVIKQLKSGFHVTETVLRETKAGLAVGKLRTHASKQVSDAAKDLVKKWKGDVSSKSKQSTHTVPSKSTKPSAKPSAGASRTAKSDLGGPIKVVGDGTRDKCVELMYDALAEGSDLPTQSLLSVSTAIEDAVCVAYKGPSAEYRARIRQLFVNLRDRHNPQLRVRVADGTISPTRFASMTSAEMASDERRKEVSQIEKDNLFKSLAAEDQQAETDGFQCGRCKQRKCVYRQAQTRSADEPMTTFVTCTHCGHKWKFS